MATAALYWLQVGDATPVSAQLNLTESRDSVVASVVMSVPVTARLSFLEVWAPTGPMALAAIREGGSSVVATAVMGVVGAATARVSWLSVTDNSRSAAAAISSKNDGVVATAYSSDARVKGVWSPALLARWWLMNGASVPVIPGAPQASLSGVGRNDSVVAMVTMSGWGSGPGLGSGVVISDGYTVSIVDSMSLDLSTAPGSQNMKIVRKRGDTYADVFRILSAASGNPISIAGYTFRMTLDPEKSPESAANNLYQLTGQILDAANGLVEFAPSVLQADQLGAFFYDVQMVDGAGRHRTIALDSYTYTQDITKT